MAETLGMLCDKLSIVKLKEYHTDDAGRLESLKQQSKLLQDEINVYIEDAVSGRIPVENLTFKANKVYNKQNNTIGEVNGDFGGVIAQLAETNCKLWHEQEKVYEFEKVPVAEKDRVVKQLAVLNLERNECIDAINNILVSYVQKNNNLI